MALLHKLFHTNGVLGGAIADCRACWCRKHSSNLSAAPGQRRTDELVYKASWYVLFTPDQGVAAAECAG
jgi:hypothetical protein